MDCRAELRGFRKELDATKNEPVEAPRKQTNEDPLVIWMYSMR
jgi:hypothetical protein